MTEEVNNYAFSAVFVRVTMLSCGTFHPGYCTDGACARVWVLNLNPTLHKQDDPSGSPQLKDMLLGAGA